YYLKSKKNTERATLENYVRLIAPGWRNDPFYPGTDESRNLSLASLRRQPDLSPPRKEAAAHVGGAGGADLASAPRQLPPGSSRGSSPCAGSRAPWSPGARLGAGGRAGGAAPPCARGTGPGAIMLLLPSAADGQGTAISRALTSASTLCQVEPVGRWFEAFVKRRNRNASASFQELEDKKELSEESEDEELQLEEFPMLKTLDPKDWKNQDHYAVLGLGHVRYKATQRQIKAAQQSTGQSQDP
uniref:DnaJ heat shock protein family (Hsp40) member C2 n=1 Tax=Equus asinus TaxID=9793 RepID=A0A8C4MMC5_EQUAS